MNNTVKFIQLSESQVDQRIKDLDATIAHLEMERRVLVQIQDGRLSLQAFDSVYGSEPHYAL